MDGSSTMGNPTSTPKSSRMLLSQARCDRRLSTDSASNSQSRARNRSAALASAMNSLVQTGVKSPGWEKNSSQRPR